MRRARAADRELIGDAGGGGTMAREMMICSQCMTTATPQTVRQAGPIGCGLFLCLVSLFVFWPLLLVGLVVMLLSSVLGSKALKKCPECKSETLIPLHTPAGRELTARAQAAHQRQLWAPPTVQPCIACGHQIAVGAWQCQHCGARQPRS